MATEGDAERTSQQNIEELLVDAVQRLDELEALSHDLASQLVGDPPLAEEASQPDDGDKSSFDVVLVCTGNRFRSPIAEACLRKFTGELPIRVSSLGTLDLGPVPALPEALKLAPRLGLDISEHRARPIGGEDLAGVDLVVGFERAHVGAAVLDGGAPRERSFTLPELVELLEHVEPPDTSDPLERARRTIEQAHAARLASGHQTRLPEVADPLGGNARRYKDTAAVLERLSRRLVERLFGLGPVEDPGAEPARSRGLFRRGR